MVSFPLIILNKAKRRTVLVISRCLVTRRLLSTWAAQLSTGISTMNTLHRVWHNFTIRLKINSSCTLRPPTVSTGLTFSISTHCPRTSFYRAIGPNTPKDSTIKVNVSKNLVEDREFIIQLSYNQLLKKHSVPWRWSVSQWRLLGQ